jgi:hypothetical protein
VISRERGVTDGRRREKVREGDLLLDTFRPPADEALDELGSDTAPAKLFERRERRLRQKVC